MEEIKENIDEVAVVSVIGLSILILLVIFIFVMLISYKKWADKRDEHYSEIHEKLKNKVDVIEDSTSEVIKKASDVIGVAGGIIKKDK